ncbi:MAG: hypothetical protein HFG67_01205, partial [Firmicutes bacterium]|nr:hypothetical protein [Bacillota bacterium]
FEALYTGELTAETLAGRVKDRDEEIKKANAAEAAERKRLIAEEEAREAAEKAKANVQVVQMPGDKSDAAIRALLADIKNAPDIKAPGVEDEENENAVKNESDKADGEDRNE